MKFSNMMNQHFNDDFDRDFLVFNVTRNVITFLRKSIYNHQNNVVTIETTKKFNNKIQVNVFLISLKNKQKIQFFIVLIARRFNATTRMTFLNIFFDR